MKAKAKAKEVLKSVVSVKDLCKYFDVSGGLFSRLGPGGKKKVLKAVDGVSFGIAPGETLSLVGESGCGKSTLARLIAGLYEPTAGSIRLFGEDTEDLTRSELARLRRRINMIFQDPYASLNPRWKVFDLVAEPIRVQQPDIEDEELEKRVLEALELVRLPANAAQKFAHQFSGGQRQRICIARALTGRPEFLICDEPTSALDVSVQAQVLNLMKELQQQNRMAYLFISHNLAVVHHMSDRVGVMYLGRLVELTSKEALFSDALHPYTRMLLAAIPNLTGSLSGKTRTPVTGEVPSPLNPPSGCAFHPRCPYATEECKKEVPRLRPASGASVVHFVACHRVHPLG